MGAVETAGVGTTTAPQMAQVQVRDRSIPVRLEDLRRLLLSDPALTDADRASWAELSRLIAIVYHHEFYARLCALKDRYAPLDPDSDCIDLAPGGPEPTADAYTAFLGPFEEMLLRANYRRLSLQRLHEAIAAPNELGLNYVPKLELFDLLQVYVRGEGQVTRIARSVRTRFRKRQVTFDGYRRMVVALKFGPLPKSEDHYARPDVLYLRMFKDVPFVDLEMHLPEQVTKVRMRLIDKAQIASPVAMGVPTLLAKLMAVSFLSLSTPALAALLAAPFSAALKSFFGFQRAKSKHLLYMIRHLYYLSLANNASVINRVVDSAEEEEVKEILLAYFLLWKHTSTDPEPWDQARIDRAVEALLRDRAGLTFDFDVADALRKLTELGLVHTDAHGIVRPLPPQQALRLLDRRWDHYYNYQAGR